MIFSPRLIGNATSSVLQTIFSGLVLFLLYRFLIVNLGAEQLGLWSVILASTSVARLSDLGLTGSVVKFVARYRAQKDETQAAQVVQTAAISIAVVMAVLVVAIYPLLDNVLELAVPVASIPQALNILPWAVISLWIGIVCGVFQSGLDGCQRIDLRNILIINSNIFYLCAAYWLVPHYGLVGLAIGQTFQSLLIMIASWMLLRHQLKKLPWIPVNFLTSKFKEMFGYSVNFQINAVAILLFEPATKLLMSRYGGLSSAAYYEMANQLIVKMRAILISANQVLVPAVAELHETAPEKIREVYIKTYRLLFFVATPFYTALLISLPMISKLWIGHQESLFLIFGLLLVVGWGLNTLSGPAYFINLGTGELKWNSIAHVSMAFINVILGLILGSIYGGLGVAISAMFALTVASSFVTLIFHSQKGIPYFELIPPKVKFLMLFSSALIAFSLWLHIGNYPSKGLLWIECACLILYLTVVCILFWLHPYMRIIIGHLIKMKESK